MNASDHLMFSMSSLVTISRGTCYFCLPLVDCVLVEGRTFAYKAGAVAIVFGEGIKLGLRLSRRKAWFDTYAVLQWITTASDGTKHTIVSSYDIHNSLSVIIIVLALEIAFALFWSPKKAAVIRDRVKLKDLQKLRTNENDKMASMDRAGSSLHISTVAGKCFGAKQGTLIVLFCFRSKITKWASFFLAVTFAPLMGILNLAPEEYVATCILYTLTGFWLHVLAISTVLCLRVDILKQLFCFLRVWYYIGANIALVVLAHVLFDDTDMCGVSSSCTQVQTQIIMTTRIFYSTGFFSTTLVLPLMDAAPPEISVFLLTKGTFLQAMYQTINYLLTKAGTASLYTKHPGCSFEVNIGVATVSFFEFYTKCLFVNATLCYLLTIRGWRHPGEALLIFEVPTLTEVHKRSRSISVTSSSKIDHMQIMQNDKRAITVA